MKNRKESGSRETLTLSSGLHTSTLRITGKHVSRWSSAFRTKIELNRENIGALATGGLHFNCVLMDSWYLPKELVKYTHSLGKDWNAEAKENKLVWHSGGWIHLSKFGGTHSSLLNTVLTVNGNRYMARSFTMNMKGMGRVRLVT